MMKIPALAAMALVFVLTGCTSSYYMYKKDLFHGKALLRQEEYGQARNLFVKASTEEKRAAPFAFAATASYKMNDLASGEGYIYEAEKAEGRDFLYARILGYKALILLKQGKRDQGLSALKAYIDYYNFIYPIMTIEDVESMWKKGEVDQEVLESLLDEQILNYEAEIQQAVTTGTGYYATRAPTGAGFPGYLPD